MIEVAALRRDGTVAGVLSSVPTLTFTDRWLGPGRWQLVVDHPDEIAVLNQPGTGIVLSNGGTVLMSGLVEKRTITPKPGGGLSLNLSGWDHTDLLAHVLAWPDPSAAVGSQPEADERSGPAESVMLGFIAANTTRLGLPIVMPASLGRGTVLPIRSRFYTLLDVCRDAVALDPMLGFRLVWTAAGVAVEVMEGQARPSVLLSDKAGSTLGWTGEESAPKATRIVVGAGGEGEARLFTETADETAETVWGSVWEQFADRRDLPLDEPDTPDGMAAEAAKRLTDGAASSSFKMDVAADPGFLYGIDYRVGDVVTVYPTGTAGVTEQLTEVTVTTTPKDGQQVTVTVGLADEQRQADSMERRLRQVEAVF